MSLFSPDLVAILVLGVLAAGTVNGVAGFGFAVVGTTALAMLIDPATAVVFMIVPILSVNLALVRDLSLSQLESCGRRFGPLIAAAILGAVVGMLVLERLPVGPLRIGLGVLSLGFVASVQRLVPLPGLNRAKERCFVETPIAMLGVGGISGALFGGTNVGVQLIAYLRSCDLSHRVFVGVVAMVFLGLNAVRVVVAGLTGLYPSATIAAVSLAAAVPAAVGVAVGKRVRHRVSERHRRGAVLGLLTVIGLRLVLGGMGAV